MSIVGGGIGGLSLALALHRRKIYFQVFEQAEQLVPVGAGILLGNNVMQVYERLQIRSQLEKVANPIHHLHITRPDLRPLSKVELAPFVKKYGVRNLAIHRAELQQVLLDSLPSGSVQLGKALEGLSQEGQQLHLRFRDASEQLCTALVGADGIHSQVRKLIFPDSRLRSARQLCWRGLAEFTLPVADQHLVREAWGRGTRFGIVPLGRKQVYWFAVQSDGVPLAKSELSELFADYHPLVADLIAATPANSIHTAGLEELRLDRPWNKDNICLLGDAAHAMTPNMGQGAGQAIEDAYLLATALDAQPEVKAAFQAYYKARKKKVRKIVRTSWQIGQMAHWRSRIPVAVRNSLLRMTPAWVNRQQLATVFKLDQL